MALSSTLRIMRWESGESLKEFLIFYCRIRLSFSSARRVSYERNNLPGVLATEGEKPGAALPASICTYTCRRLQRKINIAIRRHRPSGEVGRPDRNAPVCRRGTTHAPPKRQFALMLSQPSCVIPAVLRRLLAQSDSPGPLPPQPLPRLPLVAGTARTARYRARVFQSQHQAR